LKDCSGECCKAKTMIWLSRKERKAYDFAMKLKTEVPITQKLLVLPALSEEEPRRVIPPGFGQFQLIEDCGQLTDENQCGIYERKPEACNNLEPGTIPCLIIRARAGYEDEMPANVAKIVLGAAIKLG